MPLDAAAVAATTVNSCSAAALVKPYAFVPSTELQHDHRYSYYGAAAAAAAVAGVPCAAAVAVTTPGTACTCF